jgi:lipoprotein signal peptidase
MKLRPFWILALSLLLVILDLWLKAKVSTYELFFQSNFLEIYPYPNRGLIGGAFSEIDPWIGQIFFSCLFAFLVAFVFLVDRLTYQLPIPKTRGAAIVYLVGISSNVWERATHGRVTDYLRLKIPPMEQFAFNLADLLILCGALLLCYGVAKEAKEIWYPREARRFRVFTGPLSRDAILWMTLALTLNGGMLLFYGYTFLRTYLGGELSSAPETILSDFLVGAILLELLWLMLVAILTSRFLSRVAGPIYAFSQFLERDLAGNPGPRDENFRLREKDYFKHLELLAQKIRQKP